MDEALGDYVIVHELLHFSVPESRQAGEESEAVVHQVASHSVATILL